MFSNIRCPICGHEQSVPEHKMGRKITCPSCDTPFLAGASESLNPQSGGRPGAHPPGSPPSPTVPQTMPPGGGSPLPPGDARQSYSQNPTRPPASGNPPPYGSPSNLPPSSGGGQSPPGSPPNRTILAQPEGVIRYSCPRCKKGLESPASMAGQKIGCSTCGQRLKIPESATPAKVGVDKTMLALDEQVPIVNPAGGPPPLPGGAPVQPVMETRKGESHCLECGRSLEGREKLMTCPDCGSVFCSSACQRDHRDYAHGQRRQRRRKRPGFECPYCGADEPPYWSEVISEGGWVMFAVMLLFCFPLFWIGLLMKEERRYCSVCNARV